MNPIPPPLLVTSLPPFLLHYSFPKHFQFPPPSPTPPTYRNLPLFSLKHFKLPTNMDTSGDEAAAGSASNGGDQPPAGLTPSEYSALLPTIESYHRYNVGPGQCSSLLSQRVRAPAAAVWAIVRRFDRPQTYKHFIRSCSVKGGGDVVVGCLREVSVISGLPANTSTERLDILDDEKKVAAFTIIGGEHRLRNYRSVTTVNEFGEGRNLWTVVMESYVVDVPEGNTEDDTRLFADTVIRLNLQKLATLAEAAAAAAED